MYASLRFLALLLSLLLVGCLQKTSSEPIRIGHVAPLSGPAKASGQHARNAIVLAVDDVNREDQLIHGRRVVVVHADDRGNPEDAQAEAVRLATVGRVIAFLGGNGPSEAERLARTAQSYALPAIVFSALPTLPSGEGVVSLVSSPAARGGALGRFTLQELKPARVAVVADGRGAAATDLAAAFVKEFKERPDELTYLDDGEFPEIVKRLKRTPPQVLLIAGPARGFVKLSTLLREAALDLPLLYGGPESELGLLQTDRDATQGAYLALNYLPEVATPANEAFVKRYKERFQETPDASAALAYEGAQLLFHTLREVKSTDLGEVRRELSKTEKFESLTGPLAFDKGTHAVRPILIARLARGQPKLVKQYDPAAK